LSSSYYQQKLRDCGGIEGWMDDDFLKCRRKKFHKIREELFYPKPAFARAARVSAKNKREAPAYVGHLKGKACTLPLPLCPKGKSLELRG